MCHPDFSSKFGLIEAPLEYGVTSQQQGTYLTQQKVWP
jgi:hypothetical protein